jgi:hypothetical protein
MAERHDTTTGIELIRQGITAGRTTGDELSTPQWLTVLAAMYWKAGHTAQGVTTVTHALEIAAKSRNVFCEAELYRLKGELTLQQANQKAKGKSQKAKVTEPRPLPPIPKARPRCVSAKPSTFPASNKPNPSNSARR